MVSISIGLCDGGLVGHWIPFISSNKPMKGGCALIRGCFGDTDLSTMTDIDLAVEVSCLYKASILHKNWRPM